jgi:Protein of unknown function (DUF3108)
MRPRFVITCCRWASVAAAVVVFAAFSDVRPSLGATPTEILRYEVSWNGKRAGHGDITTVHDAKRTSVTVQAVSDGALKAVLEFWSRVQATFGAASFRPEKYVYQLKSNILRSELVDLSFDHGTGLVTVNKLLGTARECHSEKIAQVYDPVSAIYRLRRQRDFSKPVCVDIYDGKARSRLFVSAGAVEPVAVKCGLYHGIGLEFRLLKLTGDKEELIAGKVWISNDIHRVPLLLTSSHQVGTVRLELLQVER